MITVMVRSFQKLTVLNTVVPIQPHGKRNSKEGPVEESDVYSTKVRTRLNTQYDIQTHIYRSRLADFPI
jgi:hypothetical protein